MSDVNEWLDRRRWVVDGGRKVLLPKANDDRKLLVAVEKVLELHKPEEYEDPAGTFFCRTCGDWNMCEDPMGEQPDYPCPTARAIEGAINE